MSMNYRRHVKMNTHKQSWIGKNISNSAELGQGDRRVGAVDPHHLDRTGFHHLEHRHDMNRVRPAGNLGNINIPKVCQFLHMGRVVVVSETGEFAIASGLSVVLSGRLTVHLPAISVQHSTPLKTTQRTW
jgi:hypothetical protein